MYTYFRSMATPLLSHTISGLGLPYAAQSKVTDAPENITKCAELKHLKKKGG